MATNEDVTMNNTAGPQGPPEDVDPIWMSSRTARQIYALGEVEKVMRCQLLRRHPLLNYPLPEGHHSTTLTRCLIYRASLAPPNGRSRGYGPPEGRRAVREVRRHRERVLPAAGCASLFRSLCPYCNTLTHVSALCTHSLLPHLR